MSTARADLKLDEQYSFQGVPYGPDERAPIWVKQHVDALGLDEIATFECRGDIARRFFIATVSGLFVAVFTPRLDFRSRPRLVGSMTEWSRVATVQVSTEGFRGEDARLTVHIDRPAFDHTTVRDRDWQALADFARACLEQNG